MMAKIVVLGAGLGGLPAAYDLHNALGDQHEVILINALDSFQFVPSNPWVAIGWRSSEQVSIPLSSTLENKGIKLIVGWAEAIDPVIKQVQVSEKSIVSYDYLVIATGPKLAFSEVPGLGPEGYTESVCTLTHSLKAWEHYEEFLLAPGPIVVGAAQGASCFGPAYEFAMILDADLRKRKLRYKVPITFVTSEPHIGHFGLGGVGDSKGLMESLFREHDIKWVTNARINMVETGRMQVTEYDMDAKPVREHALPFSYSMVIPPFSGVDVVAHVPGLCNPKGFVLIDKYQRNPQYQEIFAIGVCVAIPPPEATPIPTGVPKTGYMIESMVTAVVANIKSLIVGQAPETVATWNAICLADFGDSGIALVALPQIPPRNVTWAKEGYWVHLAKIAFEKYFLRKMRQGDTEPIYEKYVLKALGINRVL